MKTLETMAKAFRKNHKVEGGYVLFVDGMPTNWTRDLTRPESNEPGVIAVGEDGRFVARGGDNVRGAQRWDKLDE